MIKRIWAVGASVRALAESLASAGYEVVAADLFNDFDLQRVARTQRIIDFPHDLLRLVEEVEADAWIYAGGLENHPGLVDQLAEKLPLLGNQGRALRQVRDVAVLQPALKQWGFAMPAISRCMPPAGEAPWLRKSSRSSGGLRVRLSEPNEPPLAKHEYFQRFVAGQAYGAIFVGTRSRTQLLGFTRQLTEADWTNAPGFVYPGSIGPVELADNIQQRLLTLGHNLVEHFELRGWFGVDFLVDEQGQLWILEVNPRYTASIELLDGSFNRNSAHDHIAACLGQEIAEIDLSSWRCFTGKAIMYARQSLAIDEQACAMLHDASGQFADLPATPTVIPKGAPVFSIVAKGNSMAETLDDLQSKGVAMLELL